MVLLGDLPSETLLAVFVLLPPRVLVATLSRVSRRIRAVASEALDPLGTATIAFDFDAYSAWRNGDGTEDGVAIKSRSSPVVWYDQLQRRRDAIDPSVGKLEARLSAAFLASGRPEQVDSIITNQLTDALVGSHDARRLSFRLRGCFMLFERGFWNDEFALGREGIQRIMVWVRHARPSAMNVSEDLLHIYRDYGGRVVPSVTRALFADCGDRKDDAATISDLLAMFPNLTTITIHDGARNLSPRRFAPDPARLPTTISRISAFQACHFKQYLLTLPEVNANALLAPSMFPHVREIGRPVLTPALWEAVGEFSPDALAALERITTLRCFIPLGTDFTLRGMNDSLEDVLSHAAAGLQRYMPALESLFMEPIGTSPGTSMATAVTNRGFLFSMELPVAGGPAPERSSDARRMRLPADPDSTMLALIDAFVAAVPVRRIVVVQYGRVKHEHELFRSGVRDACKRHGKMHGEDVHSDVYSEGWIG